MMTSANTSSDAVLAYFNDAEIEDAVATDDYEANEDFIVAVTLEDGTSAVYEIINVSANTMVITQFSLVATVDATMVAGDFL